MYLCKYFWTPPPSYFTKFGNFILARLEIAQMLILWQANLTIAMASIENSMNSLY